MRKTIATLTAVLFIGSATTVFAQASETQKNECLLASKNCTNQVDDIYKRMQRLDREIKKGKRVYSPEELKQLQQKLTETQELLRDMERPGK
ncbi:hypothetical protein Gbem_0555 [Citrifermentans bemidjiense Bem]|uniref:Uncharacterized protein n=1 Tax=Citrifermentans bemidjiense (strain ATCC BAA-1014 / DSM 16622 / JCM 12645 / Bem) TaxID=404380 RepID=B5ECF6_CITBB|nr:hypothetical protein [Citrifermentans bemidjiense]ACH37584.1 hypothetical protein Gbem_0555 [Citrifermentans bemidjiense Bem]